jgi:hypothetical protein
MSIVMNMRWQGVTAEQYDQARELVNWEGDVPDGAKFHVASFDGTGLRVTDVWASADHFNRFVEQRLMPGVQLVLRQIAPIKDKHPVLGIDTHSADLSSYPSIRQGPRPIRIELELGHGTLRLQ